MLCISAVSTVTSPSHLVSVEIVKCLRCENDSFCCTAHKQGCVFKSDFHKYNRSLMFQLHFLCVIRWMWCLVSVKTESHTDSNRDSERLLALMLLLALIWNCFLIHLPLHVTEQQVIGLTGPAVEKWVTFLYHSVTTHEACWPYSET